MTSSTSQKSRFLSPGWMMFGSALLCILLVPVIHAAMSQSGVQTKRLRELQLMTQSERLRIEHQFEKFQQLSPAEQQRYRDLHSQLNGDQVALKTTLADYNEFLISLNPVERAEIEQKSDLNQRVSTIKRIQNEREERQQQLDLGLAQFDERRSFLQREMNRSGSGETLTAADMEAIGAVIQANLPTDLQLKAGFEKMQGPTRYAAVLTAALKTWGPKPTGVNRQPFPEEIVEEMVGAIENEKLRSKLQKVPKKEFQIVALVMMSERALLSEYMEDVPETSDLQEFLETRDPEEKKKLMQKEPGQMYFELVKAYRELNPTPLSQSISELRKQIQSYRDVMRLRGPGRDDERGPGGRRGPGGFGPPGGRDSESARPGGRERPKPPEGRQSERFRE